MRRNSSNNGDGYQLLRPSPHRSGKNFPQKDLHSIKKEVVLGSLLNLRDDDIYWIICQARHRRPSLERLLQDTTGHPQDFDRKSTGKPAHGKSPVANSTTHLHELPVLHCMAPRVFVSECDLHAEIRVARVGPLDSRCEVQYATRDPHAVAGKSYKASKGSIIFEKGETIKAASIDILVNDGWNPRSEFTVELLSEGLVNAKLEPYHCETTVVLLDDSPFPTDKYKHQIWEDDLDNVPNIGIIVEYIKMMWQHDKIRCASMKIILSDLLDNVLFLAKALLMMYLVDCVLNVEVPEDSLLIAHDRLYTLASVAALFVVPQALVHYLESVKPFGLAFEALRLLQKTLFDRYLSYSPAAAVEEDILLAMSCDSVDTVNHIYFGTLHILALFGRIAMVCIIQFVAPLIFKQDIRWTTAVPLCVFPILMFAFLGARDGLSTRALYERKITGDAFVQFVEDAVQSQSLATECGARGEFADLCEKKIIHYNSAIKAARRVLVNNQEFAQWLSILLVAGYTLMGGVAVIDDQLPLGRFVTNIHIFAGMGQVYSDIYSFVLKIQEFTPGLKRLTHLMNVPTEWTMHAEMSRHCHAQSDQLFTVCAKQEKTILDDLPICIGGVTFTYEVNTLSHDLHSYCMISRLDHSQEGQPGINFHGHMQVSQGSLVQLIGPHHEGKTTLLKLIGGVLMPKVSKDLVHTHKPFFYIPPHLRSIYVPGEPIFLRSSLFDNLILGVKRSSSDDGSRVRVSTICRRLGLPESVLNCLEDDDRGHHILKFSHTEKLLLCLARALIANPQLLCVERHWMNFEHEISEQITHLLRIHIDERGIELDRSHRRPRTCIMTGSEKFPHIEHVDRIFSITHAKGIELLHDSGNNGLGLTEPKGSDVQYSTFHEYLPTSGV